jgi:hypothetical protein
MTYTFETARFKVTVTAEPEHDDPRDHFCDPYQDYEVLKGINSGRFMWFCAKATVYCDGREVATDYLGACCYSSFDDFRRDGYFYDMIRAACREARAALANPPRLRAA